MHTEEVDTNSGLPLEDSMFWLADHGYNYLTQQRSDYKCRLVVWGNGIKADSAVVITKDSIDEAFVAAVSYISDCLRYPTPPEPTYYE